MTTKKLAWNEEFILSAYFHKENLEKVKAALEGVADYTVRQIDHAPALVCFDIETTYREAGKLHPLLTEI